MSASLIDDATASFDGLPNWVPKGAQHYIEHTEHGKPIRALARAAGCHASTIMRQIRKVELLRDDPLVDAALRKLSAAQPIPSKQDKTKARVGTLTTEIPDTETLGRDAMRVLRRLCETGAVLAVAAEMNNAVVVREMASGGSTRTAVVSSEFAQAMALKNWIAASNSGRIIRYVITPAGRAALGDMVRALKAGGKPVGVEGFDAKDVLPNDRWDDAEDTLDQIEKGRNRVALGESPLITLSRRRDKDGAPFLSDDLVHAGERLREDFELAQMESRTTQNWDSFLTAGTQGTSVSGANTSGSSDARARVASALNQLGPGLSDVVLRCCCYLEGLETTERRLGWSARSGKIVLRIALMRLKRHYDDTFGPGGPLIG